MRTLVQPAPCGPADTLVVMLPGTHSLPEEFLREGFVRTLQEHGHQVVATSKSDPKVTATFARLLEPHGFRSTAFTPSYGMAEATLAVPLPAINVGTVIDWSTPRVAPPRTSSRNREWP